MTLYKYKILKIYHEPSFMEIILHMYIFKLYILDHLQK